MPRGDGGVGTGEKPPGEGRNATWGRRCAHRRGMGCMRGAHTSCPAVGAAWLYGGELGDSWEGVGRQLGDSWETRLDRCPICGQVSAECPGSTCHAFQKPARSSNYPLQSYPSRINMTQPRCDDKARPGILFASFYFCWSNLTSACRCACFHGFAAFDSRQMKHNNAAVATAVAAAAIATIPAITTTAPAATTHCLSRFPRFAMNEYDKENMDPNKQSTR